MKARCLMEENRKCKTKTDAELKQNQEVLKLCAKVM